MLFRSLFDGFLTRDTVDQVQQVLADKKRCAEMVAHNYEVANEFFSYEVLEQELRSIIARPQNIYRMLRSR